MANKSVLFGDKVYSQGVDIYWPSFGDAPYIISKNQTSKDEDLYPRLLDENGNPKEFSFTPGEQLYLYNDEETDIRNSYLRMIKSRQYDLHLSRKIIVDDSYPEFVNYIRPFKRMTNRIRTEMVLGGYQLDFGRRCLVQKIGLCRYYPAWPEIREIIFHDQSPAMKNYAKITLNTFPKKIANAIALDFFKNFNDLKLISLILSMVDSFSFPESIKLLEDIFSDNYYYYPEEKFYIAGVMGGHTIQNYILKSCEHIPSIGALRILEEGVKHPYEHIERQAICSIYNWGKNTAQYLSSNIIHFNGDLLKAIEMIPKKYDFEGYKNSLEFFRKI